ncbi:MAG: 2-amino-4-hydroxy-6-hydroxymethyldihydropteridine diphosphokinase [Planctomycetia bacterium]|nr:2-amino-4-hydroxy-6-hydroxymethyldihydropteridine diphosphokinase [Planctomycetia bacterium]
MPRRAVAAVGLGSNLGDRAANLRAALAAMARLPGTRLRSHSSFVETDPVGPPQPRFLNAAALVETTLTPEALLGALLGIEAALGRIRDAAKGPRTIDLDLLTHGAARRRTAFLTLPHPGLHQRLFVLLPLAAIAPRLLVPGRGRVVQLLAKIRG